MLARVQWRGSALTQAEPNVLGLLCPAGVSGWCRQGFSAGGQGPDRGQGRLSRRGTSTHPTGGRKPQGRLSIDAVAVLLNRGASNIVLPQLVVCTQAAVNEAMDFLQ